MTAISVRELRKSFGDVQAVKGISFDVPEGSFFAFLGPNGAGKSTTISIICSLLGKDSGEVTVFGNAPCLESDIDSKGFAGTLVASGSSVGRLLDRGIRPDVVVTDLDGDIDSQIEASAKGAVTAIHAHGDNGDLIRMYAGSFKGRILLTTQSTPENTVYDFGGFTDGDRAVCMAVHFGAGRIHLRGFDYDDPMPKDGNDPSVKKRKLAWAERIIGIVCPPGMLDR